MLKTLKAKQYYFKEVLAILFLLMAIYFFKQQRQEILKSGEILEQADPIYLIWGVAVSILFIILQGLMYLFSFQAVHAHLALKDCIRLFLKRNLVSVFLPAGGVTSLGFFSEEVAKKGISKTKIAFASYIFGMLGFASLALVAIPVICYLALGNSNSAGNWYALLTLLLVLGLLFAATVSFLRKGWLFQRLNRVNPQLEAIIDEISEKSISRSKILMTLLCSIAIEFLGMLHIWIALKALGLPISLEACVAGYIIATLFYAISPFLRGLGAVEVSLVIILQRHGYSNLDALSVTLLYRIFEFWIPLVLGAGAFFSSRGNILLRILPALVLASLGVVNIISVLTPPLLSRVHFLENYLPIGFIHFSSIAILAIGITLLVCAAFLIKGLRNAWRIAMLLSLLSLVGHLTKGIDYEEASIALMSIICLWFTRQNYRFKSDPKLQNFGLQTAILVFFVVMLYGVIGFYFLDKRHFNVDFTVLSSIVETGRCFFLIDPDNLPVTRFGQWFIHSINGLGVLSIGLLIYSLLKPYIYKNDEDEKDLQKAKVLLEKFGRSSDDYYKSYSDKSFFFPANRSGFISYKVASGFAIVLGDPVCADLEQQKIELIQDFEVFCLSNNIKPAYYKIPESSLALYQQLGKKNMPIGQEAIVELASFSLEGKDRKSLRNSLNALERKGFFCKYHPAPLKDGFIQKLNFVSDEWLSSMDREEILFSSGRFDPQEIKNQDVISLENADEKVVAFLNIIPDHRPNEGTYDLIRKTEDAPSGVMDALIVALIQQFKQRDLLFLNMGMASMSGIGKPKDLPEWTVKFAYEKLKQFKHYQGLYEFKDKFHPEWQMKYLVYQNHYDLLSLPMALAKVMKAD